MQSGFILKRHETGGAKPDDMKNEKGESV
ncbi:hypothetical protein CLS_16910 [[Clostridium] cf. saccharolyticum K10]|nr:hypothetical protein CLS_16910 [[Clostridium] cf. saccharolyticum K10]